MDNFKIGDKVEHYKGNRYKILAFAKHTETNEEMVVYKALDCNNLNDSPMFPTYVRPLKMFCESVEIPRFKKVQM